MHCRSIKQKYLLKEKFPGLNSVDIDSAYIEGKGNIERVYSPFAWHNFFQMSGCFKFKIVFLLDKCIIYQLKLLPSISLYICVCVYACKTVSLSKKIDIR